MKYTGVYYKEDVGHNAGKWFCVVKYIEKKKGRVKKIHHVWNVCGGSKHGLFRKLKKESGWDIKDITWLDFKDV